MRDHNLEKIVYAWDQLTWIDKKWMLFTLYRAKFILMIMLFIKSMNVFSYATTAPPRKVVSPVVLNEKER